MSKRRVVIAVGLLAALVVAYKLLDRTRSSNDESAEESGGDSSGETKEARIERARERRAQLAKAPRSVLGGVVLDSSSRQPIAGARVSLGRTSLDFGARLTPGQSKAAIVAVTDAEGRFRLEGLRAGELSVTAAARGYLPTSVDRIALGSGQEKTDIELLVARGGHELSGTVSDVGGGGIGAAYVRVQRLNEATVATLFRAPVTAFTDENGRYSMWLEDGSYFIEAGHADYRVVRRDTAILGASRVEDFSLVPGGVIEGRVLIAGTEEPVSGAMVTPTATGGRITGAAFDAAAKTGPDGRFVLTGLKPGEVNLLAVSRKYSSRTPTTVVLGIAEHRTEVTLYVDAAYTISGFVVDRNDNSKGIPRVMVAAYNIGKRSGAVTSDPSAGDGFFEIIGVVPGTYTLAAAGEGLKPEIASLTLEVEDEDVDGVMVQLSRGLSIKGRIEPPVPAYVRLEVDMESLSITAIPRIVASQLARTRADENGNFELTGLGSGKLTVVAEHTEYGAGREAVDVVSPGLTGVVVKLETTGSIAGSIVDAQGKPVARARVRAANEGGRALGFGSSFGDFNSAISNDDGSFIIRGLAGGEYRVSVRRDGQRLAWAGASVAAADGGPNKPIKIELDDGEEKSNLSLVVEGLNENIRGRVVNAQGEAVPDAWVRIGRDEGNTNEFQRRRQAQNRDNDAVIETDDTLRSRLTPKLTDPDGFFRFNNLREGKYWLSATGPRGADVGTLREVVTGSNVTIALAPMGSASGQVTIAGNPVTSFTLKIDGPRLVRLPVSSDTGSFSVERLPSGRYEFQIQSDSGRARQAVVIEGKPAVVNFELEPYAEITGVVIGVKSGAPMPGYPVLAVSEGGDTDSIGEQILTGDVPRTDENGRFVVSRQGVGNATVLVIDIAGGFAPIGRGSVALDPGKQVDAGTVYAVDEPVVAEGLRGELGMVTSVAVFAERPNKDDGASAPAEADDELLWVKSVTPGGAAEAAGVKAGDRIATIDGIEVSLISADTAEYLLRSDRNGVGNKRVLGIVRGVEPLQLEVTAKAP